MDLHVGTALMGYHLNCADVSEHIGSSSWGAPILIMASDGTVHEGAHVLGGAPIMKIDGERIYRGSTSWGAPIATVKGDYVFKGTGFMAAPIALVDGEYVYKRTTKLGGPIA